MAVTKKPKKIWDNYKELFEIQKSDRIKFVVAAATRDGFRYINIREFYCRIADGVWRPGRDGVTIPLVAPIKEGAEMLTPAHDMIESIMKAAEFAKDMDLADDANAVWYPAKEEA